MIFSYTNENIWLKGVCQVYYMNNDIIPINLFIHHHTYLSLEIETGQKLALAEPLKFTSSIGLLLKMRISKNSRLFMKKILIESLVLFSINNLHFTCVVHVK